MTNLVILKSNFINISNHEVDKGVLRVKLIVNGDDFGVTKGVTLGILDCMEYGIVTETTAMVNGLYFEQGIKEAKNRGIDKIGIHLTLTWGKPILSASEVPTLVDNKGNFHRSISEKIKYNYEEVRNELRAQIIKFKEFFKEPTHIDGHHHFYAFDEGLLEIILDLSKEFNIPARCPEDKMRRSYNIKGVKTTEGFTAEFYKNNATVSKFKDIISQYKHCETLELMCHPAYIDEDLLKVSSYVDYRKKEYEILVSDTIKNFINQANIQLISFNDI